MYFLCKEITKLSTRRRQLHQYQALLYMNLSRKLVYMMIQIESLPWYMPACHVFFAAPTASVSIHVFVAMVAVMPSFSCVV